MTIVSRPSFELKDNPKSAAAGHKLLTLTRDEDFHSYVVVTDSGDALVALSIDAGTGMARSTARLMLTPDEARALAAALAQVARFVDEASE